MVTSVSYSWDPYRHHGLTFLIFQYCYFISGFSLNEWIEASNTLALYFDKHCFLAMGVSNQNSKVFVQQNFFVVFTKIALFFFWKKVPFFLKHFKTLKVKQCHLMVKLFFENFDFEIFSATIFKMFKKLFFVGNQNDGNIQACKFWFHESPKFTAW